MARTRKQRRENSLGRMIAATPKKQRTAKNGWKRQRHQWHCLAAGSALARSSRFQGQRLTGYVVCLRKGCVAAKTAGTPWTRRSCLLKKKVRRARRSR